MWLLLLACFQRLDTDVTADTGEDVVDTADTSVSDATETRCGDGTDNDGDGAVDCDDPDCADARMCGDTDTDTDTQDTDPPVCTDDALGGALGWGVASGRASGDDGAGECGGSGRTDLLYSWTAPATDTFVFDTVGSSVDTILWAASDTCDGAALDCNDDVFGDASQIALSLRAGDVVVLGVEGSGDVQLNAWRGACADVTVGQETALYGTNSGADTTFSTACSAEYYGADIVVRWVAPSSGTWRVDTAGSEIDTILSVRPDACDADEITCNDDEDPATFVYTSALELDATAGVAYLVSVAGYDGVEGTYYLSFTAP